MVNLQTIRASNAALKSLGPGLVAVFVGGTSGIGASTAREFILRTDSPHVYLIGRNKTQAQTLITEFTHLNPTARTTFIQSDIAQLSNVSKVCADIRAHEPIINLLFLSPGFLTLKGRADTPEGLDKKLALHYYARVRWTQLLLPQLTAAAAESRETTSTPPPPRHLARVVSVLGAGYEGPLLTEDLSLARSYSLKLCGDHATTMTSLAFRELARRYPDVAFVHLAPGGVMTNAMRDFNPLVRWGLRGVMAVAARLPIGMIQTLEESGERSLFVGTGEAFGEGGEGWRVGWGSESFGESALLEKYEGDGVRERVWEHTLEVFRQVEEKGKYVP